MEKHMYYYAKVPLLLLVLANLFSCSHSTIFTPPPTGAIPILLSAVVQSRATNNAFDNNDRIGLYVLEQPIKLNGTRHENNRVFMYSNGTWVGEKMIYYPSQTAVCDFWAYYPHNITGIAEGVSTLAVEVKPNQSTKAGYSLSDFMVARNENISPSDKPVSLLFNHKLAQIQIELFPGTAYANAAELLAANPQVTLVNVKTKATYDFMTDTYSAANTPTTILTFGKFEVSGDKLIGMQALAVPQTIAANQAFIKVIVGGKKYNYSFDSDKALTSETSLACTLTLKNVEPPKTSCSINATIADWKNHESTSGNCTEEPIDDSESGIASYSIAIPDFSASSVYVAKDGDEKIAEICREYIATSSFKKQCIVVYPFNGGEANLSKGYVVAVLDGVTGKPVSETVHGGSVSWDLTSHAVTYNAGTTSPATTIYMDRGGSFVAETGSKDLTGLSVSPDIVNDPRDDSNYPLAKIGTQYWITENLKAIVFTNSTPLYLATTSVDWKKDLTNYCFHSVTKQTLYNAKAVTYNIAPMDYKVPSNEEWNQLIKYLGSAEAAHLIQEVGWSNGTNLSGFNANVTSSRDKDGAYYDASLKTSYYWSDTQKSFRLSDSELKLESSATFACAIRCIRQ